MIILYRNKDIITKTSQDGSTLLINDREYAFLYGNTCKQLSFIDGQDILMTQFTPNPDYTFFIGDVYIQFSSPQIEQIDFTIPYIGHFDRQIVNSQTHEEMNVFLLKFTPHFNSTNVNVRFDGLFLQDLSPNG